MQNFLFKSILIIFLALSINIFSSSANMTSRAETSNSTTPNSKANKSNDNGSALCNDLIIARTFHKQTNYNEALKYYLKAMNCHSISDRDEAIKAIESLADNAASCNDLVIARIFNKNLNLDEAFKYYLKALNCTSPSYRDEAFKAVESLADNAAFCSDLIVAKIYEKDHNYYEALNYYTKAITCKKLVDRETAIKSIEKLNKLNYRLVGGLYSKTINFISLVSAAFYYLFLLLASLLPILITKLIIHKFKDKKTILVNINPFDKSPTEKSSNLNFKYYFSLMLKRIRYQEELKSKINKLQSQTVYPSIRTDNIDSFISEASKIFNLNYGPIVSKIYSFINPPDYNISGFVLFYDLNHLQYIISLQSKNGESFYWDRLSSISTLGEDMKEVAYEILISIKNRGINYAN